MTRIAIVMLAFAASACASTPKEKPLSERILGLWNCTATADSVSTKAAVTYLDGGKSKLDATVTLTFAGQAAEIKGAGDATWTVLPDGRLEDTVTALTISGGTVAGNPVPVPMIQPLVQQAIVGQKSTSAVAFDDKARTMTLTDDKSNVTSCSR